MKDECGNKYDSPAYGLLICHLPDGHRDEFHYNYVTDVDWPKIERCMERNKVLEETLRKAYIALKKHENLDIDIVGEAMGILDEGAWNV